VEPVNILMVDDQPAKLLAYEAMLEDLGENLIKAGSAHEALAYLLHNDVAAVLMDVSMPDIDGFELARLIRQHPRCERTAIIFVSAIHMSDQDKVKGYETGAVDYVSVPVIPEILRAKIRVFVELHRKTAELTRLNNELEARVAARTDDLEESLARLKESETLFRVQGEMLAEADRRKDEFLAILAHELRNPLAPIRSAVELLRHPKARSAVEIDRVRCMIDRQVTHLVHLVDDLLDASRISRGKLVLSRTRVDLVKLVADAIESVRASLGSNERRFAIELPPEPVWLEADAVRLTQIVFNLVSNAVKFTSPGGEVKVELRVAGAAVEIRVNDNGLGMDDTDLARAFDPFYQGASRAPGESSGLGLGLTLVKKLVELHGGTVEARSGGPGRGSEFLVRLPRSVEVAEAPASEQTTQSPSVAQDPKRILVVDDNRDAVESLARLLELLGNQVEVAYDGDTAVRAVPRFNPDVALPDIGMPGLDGYTAARAIRAGSNGHRIALIAMTGWGQAEDKRRALDAGFDAHLVKPVSIDTLIAALAALEARAPSRPSA
jgi:signal transduction histidine kinase